MTPERLQALRMLGAAVIPDRIDLVKDAGRLSRPCSWMCKDERDEEMSAMWTGFYNDGPASDGPIIPIPLDHSIYDEILPSVATDLILSDHAVFGLDRGRGRVVMRCGALAVRVFWRHQTT